MRLNRPIGALLAGPLLALAIAGAGHAGEEPPADARARVQYHLEEVDRLSDHFTSLLHEDCPRFASAPEWAAYLDGEVDLVTLLMAHLEEAWREAKRGDDDLRREAKAPRRRIDGARALVTKFQACARENGAALSPLGLWARIEQEIPKRQAEIALPR